MCENTIIKCDHCGEQLNIDSSYPHNYGLYLASKDYGVNTTGAVYAVHQTPPLMEDKDFCDIMCLSNWIIDTMNKA